MKIIYNPIFLEHETGNHPENKKRLEALLPLPTTSIPDGKDSLSLVHTEKFISKVKDASTTGALLDPDTITSPGSFTAATHAVGATILSSQTNDFALIRPPGHHAFPEKASGFCLFNNIAIAVKNLVNQKKRVLIFDFDGHFGDGTRDIFAESDKVLYWSLHQSAAFPGGGEASDIGTGKGKGYTICNPLPPETGDDLYMETVKRFLPIAQQFKPDVVAISAGFDNHRKDPLLQLRLTLNTYYQLGKIISQEFKNYFAALEGGYNLDVLPKAVHTFLDGINQKPQRFSEEPTDTKIIIMEEAEEYLQKAETLLKKYWKV